MSTKLFRKGLFILAHSCGDTSFYSTYKKMMRNQWKPYNELKYDQEKQLKRMCSFCYENVPYYRKLFKSVNVLPSDISSIADLQKIPPLTKAIIKEHWEDFKPVNISSMKYYNQTTGGSSGIPLTYRLSKSDRIIGGALLYRGWGYGGYGLGDSMVFLAGSSLGYDTKSRINTILHQMSRNVRMLSSFDMAEIDMEKYYGVLKTVRPRFIRGYASSIFFFARWLKENDISVPSLEGVFTTSEKLFPHMRKMIGEVFQCDVYDNYGLNDGGISAFECSEHSGLHIDSERGILEVADDDGHVIDHGNGQILATSLHNYAMPFLRYVTGDEGFVIDHTCACGRKYPLLKEILGRQQEMLITPEGKYVHGEYITHIFWDIPHIKEFQVVQISMDKLIFNIVPEPDFDEKSLNYIRSIIYSRSKQWDLHFRLLDKIDRSQSGKYKFVINEFRTKMQ